MQLTFKELKEINEVGRERLKQILDEALDSAELSTNGDGIFTRKEIMAFRILTIAAIREIQMP